MGTLGIKDPIPVVLKAGTPEEVIPLQLSVMDAPEW